MYTEQHKEAFLKVLQSVHGNITKACETTKIDRGTFYDWKESDPKFAKAVVGINDELVDIAQDVLRDSMLKDFDANTAMFVAKTLGKTRGFNTQPAIQDAPAQQQPTATPKEVALSSFPKLKKSIRASIIKTLKKQGTYSDELSFQIDLASGSIAKMRMCEEEMSRADYNPFIEEYSREGNIRRVKNPIEQRYSDAISESQSALKALGMNFDAKEREQKDDSFSSFMSKMQD